MTVTFLTVKMMSALGQNESLLMEGVPSAVESDISVLCWNKALTLQQL